MAFPIACLDDDIQGNTMSEITPWFTDFIARGNQSFDGRFESSDLPGQMNV